MQTPTLFEAIGWMRDILAREAAAARRASLAELNEIFEEKREALGLLAGIDPAAALAGPEEAGPARDALRAMLRAAEENAMVLASVAGGLEAVQERLRAELAASANPGTYDLGQMARRRPHSLAASIDRTA